MSSGQCTGIVLPLPSSAHSAHLPPVLPGACRQLALHVHTRSWLCMCTHACAHTARSSPPEWHAQPSLASEQSRMSPSSAGPPSGSPMWAAVLGAHPGQAWAQAPGAGFSPGTRCKLWQSFNGKVGCSDNATRVGARSCGGRGVREGQGRAGSLKQQRTRTSGLWQVAGTT